MHPISAPSVRPRARHSRSLQVLLFRLIPALALCGLLTAGAVAQASISVTFDLKQGDKIADVTKLIAHVNSTAGIDKVEFSIDGTLRFTANSIPYFYNWDTIADTEGKHVVKVTVTDENGKTADETLNVEIDNELGLGADALAKRAREALAAGDLDMARRSGRRALKAEPDNLNGARALAAVYARSDNYEQAVAALSKGRNVDGSTEALLEMASYRMRLALTPDHADKAAEQIVAVNELRRKAADMAVEDARKHNTGDTPIAHEALGDALLNAGHIKEAADEYSRAVQGDNATVSSIERLALAETYQGDLEQATNLLKPLRVSKKDDAPLRAIYGLNLLRQYRFSEARAMVDQDVKDHVPSALVVASYADLMLPANLKRAQTEAAQAASLIPVAGDTQYALSLTAPEARDSTHAADQTLALVPFEVGPLLDRAARIVMQPRGDRFGQAEHLLDLVLKEDPNNKGAILMRCLIQMQTGPMTEARSTLEKLYRDDPKQPDLLLVLSTYANVKDDGGRTARYLNDARGMDPNHFTLQLPLDPVGCINLLYRKVHYRPYFFLTLSTLYPSAQADGRQ